jgi:hypothetical protein
MVTLFSLPDPDVLSDSSQTVHLCEGLAVIPITDIYSVVAMFPEMTISETGNIVLTGKYSLMWHTYIELASFSTGGLFDEDEDVEK